MFTVSLAINDSIICYPFFLSVDSQLKPTLKKTQSARLPHTPIVQLEKNSLISANVACLHLQAIITIGLICLVSPFLSWFSWW